MTTVPKTKTWRSRKYREWVRSHPCACCGTTEDVQCAHFGGPGKSGGTALKASDALTLPACPGLDTRTEGIWGPYVVPGDIYRIQRDLLAEWTERREGGGE